MVETVRAAVMVGPGEMRIEEFPYPSLSPGSLLLKVEMAGICGTDKHTYRGQTKQYAGTEAETDTPFPIIPGHEVVGIVAEINQTQELRLDFNGEPLNEGDRVVICPDVVCGKCYGCRHTFAYPWCENLMSYGNSISCDRPPHLFGGWAEYMYIWSQIFIYKVPEGLEPQIAVLTELMAVSYNLDKTKEFYTLAGEGFACANTVVIQGVGPLGLCHLIKAQMMGAGVVIAVDVSDYRLEMAKQFGADCVINARTTSAEERVELVRELTKGRGADIVVECAGVPEVVPEGIEMLRKGGIYVEAGNFVDTGEVLLSPHRHFCSKNIRLLGMTNHPFTGYTPSMKLMQKYANRFPFQNVVTHKYPLADAEQALEKSMEPDCMKVVIAL